MQTQPAELAKLADALDSGSSGSNTFRVQVPGSAFNSIFQLEARLRSKGKSSNSCPGILHPKLIAHSVPRAASNSDVGHPLQL
jgi:hypothetical protein